MKPTPLNRVLLVILLISAFIFFMFVVVLTYHFGTEGSVMPPILEIFFTYHVFLMAAMGAFGLTIGAVVYYLMAGQVQHTLGIAKGNASALLKFLNPDERKVIHRIMESNGKVLQSELTRDLGLSKVKIHRIVDKLKQREILTLSTYGKTNSILLNKDVYEALK